MDLQPLSRDELRQLLHDVDTAIKTREQDELKKAREEILGIASRVGVPLGDLLGSSLKPRKAPGTAPMRYQNPENPSQQWSGRGRQPKWVKEHVESGKALEDLLIG